MKGRPKDESRKSGLSRRTLLGATAAGGAGLAATMISATWPQAESASAQEGDDDGRAHPGRESVVFALEIAGEPSLGFFAEVSGVGSESEILEFDSGDGSLARKRPGRVKYGDITLKRGITSSMDAWQWRKLIEEGKIDSSRKDGSVVAYDQRSTEVGRWNFYEGWPAKIEIRSLKAGDSTVAIESMVLAVEAVERAPAGSSS